MIRRNITLLFTCICFVANGQKETDSLDKYTYNLIHNNVNEYIYNYAYKNIAAFNIRYASYSFNMLWFNTRFRTNADFFYQYLMPDHGYKLQMDIEKLDSVYPNPKYHLYKIYLNGFHLVPDKHGLPEDNSWRPKTTNYFLLALNEDNGDIKFISGQFFKSYISDDFSINKDDVTTFIPYLRLRAFDVGGVNIKFKKKRHKKWMFEGYSEIFKKPFTITVDRKDIDDTQTTIK